MNRKKKKEKKKKDNPIYLNISHVETPGGLKSKMEKDKIF